MNRLAIKILVIVWAVQSLVAAGVEFSRDIRPILSENCFQCHGPDSKKRKAGLRLDTPEGAFAELKSGERAVVAGKAELSELLRRVTAEDADDRMPPEKTGKRLTTGQIDLLRRWIEQGADYPRHWAFVAPRRPDLPEVQRKDWVRNPIDRFVLARLEKEGMSPSPEATKETLVRRATLDLTGLPPTIDEIDAYLAEDSPEAYDALVDRLLAAPQYGERMAVEWLDAARFADTHGYHLDSGRDMTRWRTWVIDAFNENKPFDQFTIEQLAGDLLPHATVEQKIASGFNRNHMINYEGGAIPEEYHNAYVVDRVNTTGTVWLGLTVGCARCHDHKYDPISQREFYQFYAFFNNVAEKGLDGQKGNAEPVLKLPTPEMEVRLKELERAYRVSVTSLERVQSRLSQAQAAWEEKVRKDPGRLTGDKRRDEWLKIIRLPVAERQDEAKERLARFYRDQIDPAYREAKKRRDEARKARDVFERQIPSVMVMRERKKMRETFVLVRGQYDKKGEKVLPGLPACLPPMPAGMPENRLGLATWLVSRNHPLTARVIVNRFWQMYFGVGLVKTAEDFGKQGEPPSHPGLLDWLAVEFMEGGWDVEAIQRLIVTSATYRQSSIASPDQFARDPENRLLARGPRFRLKAEFIRDQALALSGLLQTRIGGRSVSPYQPAGLWAELSMRKDSNRFSAQFFLQSHGADLYRRSLYTFWKRASPPPSLVTLDAPSRETCTVRRSRTNTPLQALVLMNDPTFTETARLFAQRVLRAKPERRERLVIAFRSATGRRPKPRELRVLNRVLDQQRAVFREDQKGALQLLGTGEYPRDKAIEPRELAAWTMVASTLLNLDETLTTGSL